MKYCTRCGESLEDNQTFCTSCGAKQGEDQHGSEVTPTHAGQPRPPKKPLSKKSKAGIISITAILAIVTSSHLIISSLTDPLKTVQAMDRAITEQNPDAFFEQVDLKDNAIVHKEEYLSYIDSSGWESMRDQLTDGFESEEGHMFDFSIYDHSGGEIFAVKNNPLVFGLYSTYEIEAIPTKVVATSNMNDTKVSIADETKEIKEASEFTELTLAYPGEYTVKGSAESEFGKFDYSDTLSVYPDEANETELMIDFPSNSYTIDTNKEDAILFIDGKSTGQPLSYYTEIGPFPLNKEVTVHAEWKDKEGKVHTTEKLDTQSNPWGSLSFYFEEPTEEVYAGVQSDNLENEGFARGEVEDFMLQFLTQSVDALNSQDFSMVEALFTDEGSGKAESREFIESGRVDSEVLLDGVLVDFDEVEEDQFEVTMSETYEINYSDGDFKEPTLESTYLLKIENGELKVDSYLDIN